MASGGGRSTKPVLKVSLLLEPSSRKLFDWLRMPFTLKPEVTAPNPPGVASPPAPPSPVGGATTPGMSVPSWVKLRPFSGSSTTFCSSMTMPSVACEVSTSGASPVTVTASSTAPTAIVTSTRAVSLTRTVMPSRVVVLNPGSVALTLYRPGASSGTAKKPSAPVTTTRVWVVPWLTTSTVTPGTTAPVSSLTTPVIPPVACAIAARTGTSTRSMTSISSLDTRAIDDLRNGNTFRESESDPARLVNDGTATAARTPCQIRRSRSSGGGTSQALAVPATRWRMAAMTR